MATADLERLATSRYLLLTTFKRDGTAGKLKRLRNSGRVLLAPCDACGKVKGDQREAQAEVYDNGGARTAKPRPQSPQLGSAEMSLA